MATLANGIRPIRWIGRRTYGERRVAGDPRLRPVRFRAGSLGDGLPRRDLLVSPAHAMFLDGVLIPALALVNGASIMQAGSPARVEYVHIELDNHDIILAEGAAAESFVDCDNRGMFDNARAAPGPQAVAARWAFCAERVVGGPRLAAVRARLSAQAAALGLPVGPAHAVRITAPGTLRAAIPAGVAEVHLLAGNAVGARDRRHLGAAIGGVSLDGVRLGLDDPALGRGFHEVEHNATGGWRWTSGDAVLRFDAARHARALEVQVIAINEGAPAG